jgi:4-diphosphocytidyl-2-C-methyl-D-erythritol kinase
MALVSEAARAKINLTLHVLRRREDGFHLIESLVVFADVADRLNAGFAPQFGLTVTGPFAGDLAPGEDNIVLEAARAVAHGIGGVPPGAELMLEKNLPVVSGIGGGSADAAACIRALLKLHGVKAGDIALSQLASGIGADVNVCLASKSAVISGVGNVVEPAPRLPRVHAVLVNPGLPLATPAVYHTLGLAPGEDFPEAAPPLPADGFRTVEALAEHLRATRNDLRAPATRLVPAIADVEAALAAMPGCLVARMSGSGATCFGLFASRAEAHDGAQWLAADHPDWWVRATMLG